MDIKFVDIFAGTGGLGEGFSRYADFYSDTLNFKCVKSIEKDPVAAKTLTLRNTFHLQKTNSKLDQYFNFLDRKTSLDNIVQTPEWAKASDIVWNAELGKLPDRELHSSLKAILRDSKDWVLLGGPPCQAYSIIGRSRLKGLGAINLDDKTDDEINQLVEQKNTDFYNDTRHVLYKEYLKIVAIHQPSIFVMENVKGILSSKVGPGKERIFPIIEQDLKNPHIALKSDECYQEITDFHPTTPHSYRLFSFVTGEENPRDRDFTIHSEEFGIPQKRHRVIILGVRDDIIKAPKALQKQKICTVSNAIKDLPKLRSGLSKRNDNVQSWQEVIKNCFPSDATAYLNGIGQDKKLDKILNRKSIRLKSVNGGVNTYQMAV